MLLILTLVLMPGLPWHPAVSDLEPGQVKPEWFFHSFVLWPGGLALCRQLEGVWGLSLLMPLLLPSGLSSPGTLLAAQEDRDPTSLLSRIWPCPCLSVCFLLQD